MLAQILAIAVAVGSALLFITAFVFPKLHRQDDFFWGAVGLFYALVLWVCAGQMTGAILLGQLASVILLGWFAWEMLRLRQAIADPSKIPDLDQVSLIGYVKQRFNQPKPAKPAKTKPEATPQPKTPAADTTPEAVSPDVMPPGEAVTPAIVAPEPEVMTATPSTPELEPTTTPEPAIESTPAAIAPESPSVAPETITPTAPEATESKKGFALSRLFGRKESPKEAITTPADESQSLDDIFDDEPEPAVEDMVTAEPEPAAETTTPPTTAPENTAEPAAKTKEAE